MEKGEDYAVRHAYGKEARLKIKEKNIILSLSKDVNPEIHQFGYQLTKSSND
ncbi:MAG: hypothetical protein KAR38_01225 [Calditrichia bacterium]|nr:hypothetical protein [Calditrichia bacterium]